MLAAKILVKGTMISEVAHGPARPLACKRRSRKAMRERLLPLMIDRHAEPVIGLHPGNGGRSQIWWSRVPRSAIIYVKHQNAVVIFIKWQACNRGSRVNITGE